VLGRVMPSAPISAEARVAEVWRACLGEEIAANARPVSLRSGRLVVATSSPAWAHALQLMEPGIVARLNDALQGRPLGQAVFRAAGWGEPAGAGPRMGPDARPGTDSARAAAEAVRAWMASAGRESDAD